MALDGKKTPIIKAPDRLNSIDVLTANKDLAKQASAWSMSGKFLRK
jgi:hypothetical protein